MEVPSERTQRRLAELKRKHGEIIANAQLYLERSQSWPKADRAHDPHQLIKRQHQARKRARFHEFGSDARRASRNAMNAMKKTVEIAAGSADFHALVVAAYGEEILPYRKCAEDHVFEDITGLKLTESDEE